MTSTLVNKGIETVTSAISSVVKQVEKIDESAEARPKVYGEPAVKEASSGELVKPATDYEKLRMVSGDLLDLWIYEGSKGLAYIQQTQAYKVSDSYLHYLQTFQAIKTQSAKLSTQVKGVASDVQDKLVLFYDQAQNFVGLLIQVLQERQPALLDYIRKTYTNVSVFVQDNYMRLDFNHDGRVDMEDLRKSIVSLYDFLKNFDYIEASTKIRSQIYTEAQKYLKGAQTEENKKIAAAGDIPLGGSDEGNRLIEEGVSEDLTASDKSADVAKKQHAE